MAQVNNQSTTETNNYGFNFYYLINGIKYVNAQINSKFRGIKNNVVYCCPFEPLSGGLWNTNIGYIPDVENNEYLTSTINNTQATYILTGNQQQNYRWVNSIAPTTAPNGYCLKKNFQIGDYFTGFTNDDFQITTSLSEISLNDEQYTNLESTNTLSVTIPAQTNYDFTQDNVLTYIWIVKSKQFNTNTFYYIRSVTQTINNTTGNVESWNIVFSSLNLAFAKTGKELMQLINLSLVGDNYPFPELVKNEIIINPLFAQESIGVKFFQVETSSAYNFCSFELIGGIADSTFLNPTQKLLLYEPIAPIHDKLQLNGAGVNAYFVWWNAKPMWYEVFANYQESIQALTNLFGVRQFIGGLARNLNGSSDLTPNTNNNGNGGYYAYYNSGWNITPQATTTYTTYSQYVSPSNQTLNFNNSIYTICDILNLNSLIYENIAQYSPNYQESVQFQISDIPIIGSIWSKLIMGCNPIFYIDNYQLSDLTNNLTLITPAHQYLTATAQISNTQAPIDLNFFNYQDNQSTRGAKVNVCNLMFSLTDRFIDPNQVVTNYVPNNQDVYFGNEPQNGIYNTLFIGQTKYPNGTKISFPTPYLTSTSKAYTPSNNAMSCGFYIGAYKQQGVGLTQCRVCFYTDNITTNIPMPVYQNIFLTSSAIKNNPTLWTDALVFSIYTDDILQNVNVVWPGILQSTIPNVNVVPPFMTKVLSSSSVNLQNIPLDQVTANLVNNNRYYKLNTATQNYLIENTNNVSNVIVSGEVVLASNVNNNISSNSYQSIQWQVQANNAISINTMPILKTIKFKQNIAVPSGFFNGNNSLSFSISLNMEQFNYGGNGVFPNLWMYKNGGTSQNIQANFNDFPYFVKWDFTNDLIPLNGKIYTPNGVPNNEPFWYVEVLAGQQPTQLSTPSNEININGTLTWDLANSQLTITYETFMEVNYNGATFEQQMNNSNLMWVSCNPLPNGCYVNFSETTSNTINPQEQYTPFSFAPQIMNYTQATTTFTTNLYVKFSL